MPSSTGSSFDLNILRSSPSVLARPSVFPVHTAIQGDVDLLVSRFISEASDSKMLAALTAGGFAYRWGKMGVMGSRLGHVAAMPLRPLSIAVGLGAEVTAFELTNRTLESVGANLVFAHNRRDSNHGRSQGSPLQAPNLWSWSGPGGWKQSLLSDLITFGILKGAGHLSRDSNLILQHSFSSVAMVAGQNVIETLSPGVRHDLLADAPTLAEQFLHAEVTNLQMGVGMSLVHGLAPRITALERELDLSLRSKTVGVGLASTLFPERGNHKGLPLKNHFRPFLSSLRPALSGFSGDPGMEGAPRGRAPLPDPDFQSNILMMTNKGDGGKKYSNPHIERHARAAKNNLFAVFILRDYARAGVEEGYTALEEVAQTNGEAQMILFEMALGGDDRALKSFAKLAQTKYRCVQDLYSLAQKGNEGAKRLMKELDISFYRKEPGFDPDIVQVMQYLTEAGNSDAMEWLGEMAKSFRHPVIALQNLARQGFDRAFEWLARASATNLLAVSALHVLAVDGNEIALHTVVRLFRENAQMVWAITDSFLEVLRQKSLQEHFWAFELLLAVYPLFPKRVVETFVGLAKEDNISLKGWAVDSLKLASREHNGHHAVFEGIRTLVQIPDRVLNEFSLEALGALAEEGNPHALSVVSEIHSGKLQDPFLAQEDSAPSDESEMLRSALQYLLTLRSTDREAYRSVASRMPSEKKEAIFTISHNALVFLRVLQTLNREELKYFHKSIRWGEIEELKKSHLFRKVKRLFTYEGAIMIVEGKPLAKVKTKTNQKKIQITEEDFIPFFENDQEAKMEIVKMMEGVREVIEVSLSALNDLELHEFFQTIRKRPSSLRRALEDQPWFEKVEDFFIADDEENIPPFTLLTIEELIQNKLFTN